jgi:hypothetical protein
MGRLIMRRNCMQSAFNHPPQTTRPLASSTVRENLLATVGDDQTFPGG